MTQSLNLEPELEQHLKEIAESKGLSVEGYLLTLVEAIVSYHVDSPRGGLSSVIWRIQHAVSAAPEPTLLADSAIRQQRGELILHKERAVEAVTKMNLLNRTIEQQQLTISQKEIQALTFARDANPKQALRCFQESCIYGQNLKQTLSLQTEASQEADELLTIYKKQESKAKSRASTAQAAALSSIQSESAKSALTEVQMELRIATEHTQERWEARFAAWLKSFPEPREAESDE